MTNVSDILGKIWRILEEDFPWGDVTPIPAAHYVCFDGRPSPSVYIGSGRLTGKFIDQLATLVSGHAPAGKIPYRYAWHTLSSLLYAEGLDPNTGLPFDSEPPPIGLPADRCVASPTPALVAPFSAESFPHWSAGDLRAERDKRRKLLDTAEATAQDLRGRVMAVEYALKKVAR